ncbi:MAG: hypothetical protein SZ59_C0002G0373 [candidate division TM6 bacterium GW2011_GWF2_28_16]|nr:MAG: hypothetical protein SZ59_C0002G0373 [candidate division TM6 bacterium GW2011_GWF2_28_16]
MLDKNKLYLQIKKNAQKLFSDFTQEFDLAKKKWQEISCDINFKNKVEFSHASFLTPTWLGNLNDKFKIDNKIFNYSILSVDGSQVYPDRNISGANCCLINIGSCLIKYNNTGSSVKIGSEPLLFLLDDLFEHAIPSKDPGSSDLVDLKREELELLNLLNITLEQNIDIAFVDGTVIFWFLESKPEEVKNLFLNLYLNILQKFYDQKKIIAGFISFPKSKELINLIKIGLCKYDYADCIACYKIYNNKAFDKVDSTTQQAAALTTNAPFALSEVEGVAISKNAQPCMLVDNLIDTKILRNFLNINERTTVFFSNSKIVDSYPDYLKPCFFYLNAGVEIVRIETFKYIAQDEKLINLIASVALDQINKGLGYPVTLAQAHEAAVVKGPDREFFYNLLQKEALDQSRRLIYSQKSIKKRGTGV